MMYEKVCPHCKKKIRSHSSLANVTMRMKHHLDACPPPEPKPPRKVREPNSRKVWLHVSKAGGGQTVGVWAHEPTLGERALEYAEYLDLAPGDIKVEDIGFNTCIELRTLKD